MVLFQYFSATPGGSSEGYMDAYGPAYSNGLAQEEGEDYSETPKEDYGDELFESYEMTNNDIQQFKVDNATEKKNTKDLTYQG